MSYTGVNANNVSVQDEVTLVCGADDKFAMPLAVTLFSALINLRQGVVPILYIIDGGIIGNNKRKIERVFKNAKRPFKLQWVPFNLDKIPSLKETGVISKAAYLRILVPDLLPPTVSKVVYLDCDMIVEADLANLWELPFSREAAMGVQDFCFPFISSPAAISNFDALDIPANAPYCNSGLIIMNLNYWRSKNYTTSIFDYLNAIGEHLKHFDQDGINVIIAGRWKLLDPRWNVTLSSTANFGDGLDLSKLEIEYYKKEFRTNPFIIHFTSRYKPWHTGSGNKEALKSFYYDQYFIRRYFFYLKRSKWFKLPSYTYWANYRKAVLLFQYKIPRRISLLTRKKA